jgi:hypothetical protein
MCVRPPGEEKKFLLMKGRAAHAGGRWVWVVGVGVGGGGWWVVGGAEQVHPEEPAEQVRPEEQNRTEQVHHEQNRTGSPWRTEQNRFALNRAEQVRQFLISIRGTCGGEALE